MTIVDPFQIAVGNDDWRWGFNKATYPPASTDTGAANDTFLVAARSLLAGPTFQIQNGLTRFNTAALWDSATILSAKVRLYIQAIDGNADSRQISADYTSAWAAVPPGSAEYTSTAGTNAHAGTNIAALTAGAYFEFDLANLSNINKSGYTYIRWHVSGGQPTGLNRVTFGALDDGISFVPELVVTYTVLKQEIRAWLRKKGTGSDPAARVEIMETSGGTVLATPIPDTTISSTTGQLLTGYFDASVLGAISGANVEARVVSAGAAGGAVEVGAIRWGAKVFTPSLIFPQTTIVRQMLARR